MVTALTSEGFTRFLFNDNVPYNQVIQPNKLNIFFLTKRISETVSDICRNKLRFAYVGAFRYPNKVFRYAKIIGKYYPQYEFHFYCYSQQTNQVINITKYYENVKYFGSFKNSDDLISISNNIDIVIACCDIHSLNERIAEPNKLYEELYFNKPIIVSKNTFLPGKVKRLQCGFPIDASSDKSIISYLNSIPTEEIKTIRTNNLTIKDKEIIDNDSNNLITVLENAALLSPSFRDRI